jgi:hypothetical protein
VFRGGLCHPLAEFPDVIGRHFRQLTRSEGSQLKWLVLFPISTLVMIIGTQESVEALWSSPHVIVRFVRSVILLVMLPWRIKPRQVLENAGGARRHGRRKLLGRIKRQLRWACEWSTHQYYGPEHIGPDDCAIGRYRRTEVMPDHSGHGAVAKRSPVDRGRPHDIPLPQGEA